MTRFRTAVAAAASLAGFACFGGGCATAPKSPPSPTLTKFAPPPGAQLYVDALSHREQGNEARAIEELERALQENPNLRMARSTLGEIYMERKAYDQAIPHLQSASDLDPYTLENHYNLGLSFQLLNRLQDAAMAYLRGLKISPEDFKTNMNLGLVYFALGQLDPSIYYLEKASRIEPGNVRAWSNIGVVYDARGNLVLAEASYRKALELDPVNESTLINLSANLTQQKRGTEAVAVARHLVAQHPGRANLRRLGDAQTIAEQWADAEQTYRSAIRTPAADGKTETVYLPALNALAEMYAAHYEADLRMDDSLRQQAIATWEESLKLEPNQPAARNALAQYQDAKLFR